MKNNDTLLEVKVLGAILQSPALFPHICHLTNEAFHDRTNAIIYECIEDAIGKNLTVSPSTLALKYKDKIEPIGGMSMLDQIADQGSDIITNFTVAVERLMEMQRWRQIADLGRRLQIAVETKERSPNEILSGIARLANQYLSTGASTSRSKSQVAKSVIARTREQRETVTTGINTLDYIMQGGLQKRRLYGIGAPYGRGKTILLGSISDKLNLQLRPHLFITMETEPEDIEIRSFSAHINQNASVMFDQDDPDHESAVSMAEKIIDRVPDYTHYEYAPGANMDQIHRMILRAKAEHNIDGFMLDYWQLIKGQGKGISRDQHLQDCSDALAAICRKEHLWGIMTAQTDERGVLVGSTGLLRSAALYVRLQRDEDQQAAYFVTEKSNYTRYSDTGNESTPGMIFDMSVGPHFRNTEAMDLPGLAAEQDNSISV